MMHVGCPFRAVILKIMFHQRYTSSSIDRTALKAWSVSWLTFSLLFLWLAGPCHGQTDGSALLSVRINNYSADPDHWTVVWVTDGTTGTFIKTLWRQGPALTNSHWDKHCRIWYTAKNNSTAFDGYSSATARSYSGKDSPVILTWNCRDAGNQLVADGTYKFWVQYAEDGGQGPYTANGLAWTKGSGAATTTFPDEAPEFTNMSVEWAPVVVSTPPVITSPPPPTQWTMGVPFGYTCTATGTAPVSFSAVGLPDGLTIDTNGIISGVPSRGGSFSATITASNGVVPNATQVFPITITVIQPTLTLVRWQGSNLNLQGRGPPNGQFSLRRALEAGDPIAEWTVTGSGTFDEEGLFDISVAPMAGVPAEFFRVQIP